jgi:hypothetical protein
MAALAPAALGLVRRHPLNALLLKRIAHFFHTKGLNDGPDHFHGLSCLLGALKIMGNNIAQL